MSFPTYNPQDLEELTSESNDELGLEYDVRHYVNDEPFGYELAEERGEL